MAPASQQARFLAVTFGCAPVMVRACKIRPGPRPVPIDTRLRFELKDKRRGVAPGSGLYGARIWGIRKIYVGRGKWAGPAV